MFPYNDTPLKKKEEQEYALRCATSICSMSFNNKIETQKAQYLKNIKYIEALQNSETYMNYLNKNINILGVSNLDVNANINTSPLGIIRLIYRSIYSRISKISTDVSVEGTDEKTL